MKRTRVVLSLLLAAIMLLPNINLASAAVKENTIIESVFADPMALVPGFGTDAMISDMSALAFDALADVDENFNIYPKMAESWEVSKDGITYTVKLRQGWKFHDGKEVTAEDVKFGFELIMNPETNSQRRTELTDYIKSIEVKDKYTVVFTAKSFDAFFDYRILTSPYIFPKHILEKVAPKDAKSSAWSQKPIGCGPMKFVEYRPGERIVFEKFNDYYAKFKPKTPCDKWIFQINPSQATALLRTQKGDANFTFVPAADIPATKKISNLTVKDFPDTSFMYIQWNLKRPFFQDKKVRQALTYGINTDAISKGIYKGYYIPGSAWYPPTYWVHNPKTKQYKYNVALAKKLLDEAGWKVGKDGIREKNGVKFKFTLLALKGNAGREKTCVFIQSSLRQLGIQVEVRALEWTTLNEKYIDVGNFDAAYVSLQHGSIPQPEDMIKPGKAFNPGGYNNPEASKLCDELVKTADKKKQKEIMFKLQDIVAEDLPFSVLLYPSNTYAYDKSVKDLDMKWFGRWQPAEWHVQN